MNNVVLMPAITPPKGQPNPCFPNCIPIDQGIVFLLLGAVILGIFTCTKKEEI